MTNDHNARRDRHNRDHAERAADAFNAYAEETAETDTATLFRDLLADLMHLADREGIDFPAALSMARGHHEAELAPTAEPN